MLTLLLHGQGVLQVGIVLLFPFSKWTTVLLHQGIHGSQGLQSFLIQQVGFQQVAFSFFCQTQGPSFLGYHDHSTCMLHGGWTNDTVYLSPLPLYYFMGRRTIFPLILTGFICLAASIPSRAKATIPAMVGPPPPDCF